MKLKHKDLKRIFRDLIIRTWFRKAGKVESKKVYSRKDKHKDKIR